MTREERKRARRRGVVQTLGIVFGCILLWVATSYAAEWLVPTI